MAIFQTTSKKPVIIAGSGVRSAGAVVSLRQLHENTHIPILTTMNAVDIIQGDNKIGFIGVYGNRIANMIVSESDLVIAIGARLGLRQIGNKKEYFAPCAKLVRADIDQYELSRTIKDNEEKHLIDADAFIQLLLNENIASYSEWNEKCQKAKKILDAYDNDIGNNCIRKISDILPEDAVVAIDIGQNQCWAAQSLALRGQQGRILIGGSYGSMGCALPYAIGAAIAYGAVVYCITGDGGLQMNIQELQTVVSNRLPVKIIVMNNRALGKISEIQGGSYGGRFSITTEASGYSVPDFEKVANAYGIKASTLNTFEELNKYENWLSDADPCLINILLPEDTRLLPKMNWNQKDMEPSLDEKIARSVIELLR